MLSCVHVWELSDGFDIHIEHHNVNREDLQVHNYPDPDSVYIEMGNI